MFDQATFLEKVKKYISGEISLKELRDEYIGFYPVLFNGTYPIAEEIIDEIELGLVEIKNSRMTEENLKDKLGEIVMSNGIFIVKEDFFVYETESPEKELLIEQPHILYEDEEEKDNSQLIYD